MCDRKPQYKDLKFKDDKHIEQWLRITATKKIRLLDRGQATYEMWIDHFGEILNANMQGWRWVGSFVHLESLYEERPLMIWSNADKKYKHFEGFIVEKITNVKIGAQHLENIG